MIVRNSTPPLITLNKNRQYIKNRNSAPLYSKFHPSFLRNSTAQVWFAEKITDFFSNISKFRHPYIEILPLNRILIEIPPLKLRNSAPLLIEIPPPLLSKFHPSN